MGVHASYGPTLFEEIHIKCTFSFKIVWGNMPSFIVSLKAGFETPLACCGPYIGGVNCIVVSNPY